MIFTVNITKTGQSSESEIRRLASLTDAGAFVIGIEPHAFIKQACSCVIDPQHGGTDQRNGFSASTLAVEMALNGAFRFLPEDVHIEIGFPDLDAFTASAVLLQQYSLVHSAQKVLEEIKASDSRFLERLLWVDVHDRAASKRDKRKTQNADTWEEHLLHDPLVPLHGFVRDYKIPALERVQCIYNWLRTGEEPAGYRESAIQWHRNAREATRFVDASDEIAVIESTHQGSLGIGYRAAPVVIAMNPSFSTEGEAPCLKFTIGVDPACERIDLHPVWDELNRMDAAVQKHPGRTWGGQAKIGGSPAGIVSELTWMEVKAIVERYLKTPESSR